MKEDLMSFILLLKVMLFYLDFLAIYTDIYISSICVYVKCMIVRYLGSLLQLEKII